MKKVLIVGGGAAGMLTAILAARKGAEVHLFEKNEKLGKKLFITGKGRCNLTNACELEDLFANIVSNKKFMYSSLYGFTNQDTMSFFEELGLQMKVERGNRVFPLSDHSSDVIKALEREMRKQGVQVHLNTKVKDLYAKEDEFGYLLAGSKEKVYGDACIIATGGKSYQTTGSTGDGYRFAESIGHTIKETRPSLVPLEVAEDYAKELQGLSLRNIEVIIMDGKRLVYKEFGEMLFTHYGVSGPLILSASSYLGDVLRDRNLTLFVDLKPARSFEQMDERVLREFEQNRNKQFKNAIGKLFPAKLLPVMIKVSGIEGEKKISDISKEERKTFVEKIKRFPMTITRLRDYNEAIITQGGVSVKEINPTTMESKKVKGIYFVGEVLDVDAKTGGYNLQIAWSTAAAAAAAINMEEE